MLASTALGAPARWLVGVLELPLRFDPANGSCGSSIVARAFPELLPGLSRKAGKGVRVNPPSRMECDGIGPCFFVPVI